jgi:hypothetical protein
MCSKSDEYVYAHGTTCFWHFNNCQSIVLHAYNRSAGSKSIKRKCGKFRLISIIYVHLQKKLCHEHFHFLPLHFKAQMPKHSSHAQIGMDNLGHYTHKKSHLSKSKNKENHVSYLPAVKMSEPNLQALTPRTLPCEY